MANDIRILCDTALPAAVLYDHIMLSLKIFIIEHMPVSIFYVNADTTTPLLFTRALKIKPFIFEQYSKSVPMKGGPYLKGNN